MSTLDRIMQLQEMCMSDSEISSQLQNEGVQPREIYDALNQAKIKSAVFESQKPSQSQNSEEYPPEQEYSSYYPQAPQPNQNYPQDQPPQNQYPPQENTQGYYPQTPQPYSGQEYYPPSNQVDSETISEIAEQVVSEKLTEFKIQLKDFANFKTTIQDKVSDIDSRLKRIESSIDKLQNAIIGKIGEISENNSFIHKDLENLHGTVSKLMDPLIDNFNEMKKAHKKKE